MGRVEEIPWLDGRAVLVSDGLEEMIVAEADWMQRSGDPQPKALAFDPGSSFTTAGGNVVETVYAADPARQGVFVFNDDIDTTRVAWVSEGPLPPKPLWPGGPGYRSRTWRGPVFVRSALPVRIARAAL